MNKLKPNHFKIRKNQKDNSYEFLKMKKDNTPYFDLFEYDQEIMHDFIDHNVKHHENFIIDEMLALMSFIKRHTKEKELSRLKDQIYFLNLDYVFSNTKIKEITIKDLDNITNKQHEPLNKELNILQKRLLQYCNQKERDAQVQYDELITDDIKDLINPKDLNDNIIKKYYSHPYFLSLLNSEDSIYKKDIDRIVEKELQKQLAKYEQTDGIDYNTHYIFVEQIKKDLVFSIINTDDNIQFDKCILIEAQIIK